MGFGNGEFVGGGSSGAGSSGGGITEITSEDDSVTITDPTGPTTDLSVAASGGWPSVDGSGDGNLVAELESGDTTGYSFIDGGSGGFTVNVGDESQIELFDNEGSHFLVKPETFEIEMLGQNENVNITAGGNPDSSNTITIRQTVATNTGGIVIEDDGTAGIGFADAGGGVGFNLTGPLLMINLPFADPANQNQIFVNPTGQLSSSENAANIATAGHLASDYTVTGSLATFLTTDSLGVGRWLVNFNAGCNPGATESIEIEANVGTATATFEGVTSCEAIFVSGAQVVSGSMSFIVDVTVAGTIIFQAKASATANASAIKAETSTSGFANATGYTAVPLPN